MECAQSLHEYSVRKLMDISKFTKYEKPSKFTIKLNLIQKDLQRSTIDRSKNLIEYRDMLETLFGPLTINDCEYDCENASLYISGTTTVPPLDVFAALYRSRFRIYGPHHELLAKIELVQFPELFDTDLKTIEDVVNIVKNSLRWRVLDRFFSHDSMQNITKILLQDPNERTDFEKSELREFEFTCEVVKPEWYKKTIRIMEEKQHEGVEARNFALCMINSDYFIIYRNIRKIF